jgi:hypothetical protein
MMDVAKGEANAKLVKTILLKQSASVVIDELYGLIPFSDHLVAIESAREFAKEYRNIASHPAKSAEQAFDKVGKCRRGLINRKIAFDF